MGETLGIDEVLVSPNGTFTMGFFTPGKNTSSRARNRYLGLWYSSIPDTILWVANREQPLVDSGAFLTLTENGNLALVDGNKRSVWSTSVTSASNDTVAVLMETGNLVLKQGANTSLWESFDYQTDTLLQGMKVKYNPTTFESNKLVAWRSADDPSPGDVFFQIKYYCMFLFNKTDIIWRSNSWDGKNVTYSKKSSVVDRDIEIWVHFLTNTTDTLLMHVLASGSLPAKISVNPAGTLEIMAVQKSKEIWEPYQTAPTTFCEKYGRCGPWATCNDYQARPTSCECLYGFIPKKKVEWDNGIFTAGCERRTQLQRNNAGNFKLIDDIKVPDKFSVGEGNTEAECRLKCLSSSNCTAYLFRNHSSPLTPPCLIWYGDLLDVRTLYDGEGRNLYIRLAASEIGENGKSNEALRPSLISASSVLIIAALILIIM